MAVLKRTPLIIGLAATALLAGCTSANIRRGYVFDPALVSAIQPGVDNKDSIKAMMGNPSSTGTFNANKWYYVSRMQTQRAFFNERPHDQRIVAITFSQSGTVAKVDDIGFAAATNIDPVDDTTPTRGKKLGFFEQIFGNIGRFAGAPGGGGGGAGGAGG